MAPIYRPSENVKRAVDEEWNYFDYHTSDKLCYFIGIKSIWMKTNYMHNIYVRNRLTTNDVVKVTSALSENTALYRSYPFQWAHWIFKADFQKPEANLEFVKPKKAFVGGIWMLNKTTNNTVVFQHNTYQDHPMPPLYRRSSDNNLVFLHSSDCSLAMLLAPLSL